jgi:hypothetical protein
VQWFAAGRFRVANRGTTLGKPRLRQNRLPFMSTAKHGNAPEARGRPAVDVQRRISPGFGTSCGQDCRNGNPVDLPVEQPILFDLAINLKAAKARGT